MNNDIREQILEWFTGNDTCFLIGAGCSACAGKPLIKKLTQNVLDRLGEELRNEFDRLKSSGDRPPTIEDLINYLVRYRDILSAIDTPEPHCLSVDNINSWLSDIKKCIVSEVDDGWKPSKYHIKFLKRLRGTQECGTRDIFSLNYDTLFEASLDVLRFPYTDGFRGTNRAWFDPQTFDDGGSDIAYRIHKLHGSINWTRDSDGHVRRGLIDVEEAANEPVVVYPSEQKYLQTQYGIYESLIGRFRNRLRMKSINSHLVVLGYSFNDEHINEAICDSVNAPQSNLTVVAFVGREEDAEQQNRRLEALSERCDYRFNAFIGDHNDGRFIGYALDGESSRDVLKEGLWKFENLVDYIAGVTDE